MAINKKTILIVSSVLVLTCLGFLVWEHQTKEPAQEQVNQEKQGKDCAVQTEERIVRGTSLSPLIEPGDTVKVLFGYYNCHNVEREDIIAYNYAGNKDPIIKIVKGIPGDTFALKESGSGWNILINDQILKNSEDQPYMISGSGYKMLSLYATDYPIIPENTYLILSDLATGGIDSTHFGLVDKDDILGKVEK